MISRGLHLLSLPKTLAVARFDRASPLPPGLECSSFLSVTRTADELSIICDEELAGESWNAERGWTALRVEGTLEFSEVGVLSSLAAPLAEAEVSIFVISSFDTDYLLVPQRQFDLAVKVLENAEHRVD
ncbi:MAG: ACT domain-containing protein [Planctomycetota bacterium]